MRALVLCAGFGTRLGDLTRHKPKPLLPVGELPLVGHILRRLARAGVSEVGVNLHFGGAAIQAALGDGSRHGVTVRYFREPALLGTAGSLRAVSEWLFEQGPALLHYGDILSDQPLSALRERHGQQGAEATLLVHRRRRSNSVVEVDECGRVQRFWERPDTDPVTSERWVFSGVAMLSRSILQWVPPGPADLPRDVLAPHVPRLHARAEPLSSFRVAVDSPARLRQARRALLEGRLALLDASGQSSTEQRV